MGKIRASQIPLSSNLVVAGNAISQAPGTDGIDQTAQINALQLTVTALQNTVSDLQDQVDFVAAASVDDLASQVFG